MPLDEMDGHAEGLAEFRVDAPVEIAAILKQLADGSVMLSLATPSGASMIATVWAVDRSRDLLCLSVGAEESSLQRVLSSEEVVAVGYNDNIKLQFDVEDAVLVRGDSHLALNARFPSVVYRFQRREYFRVRPLHNSRPVTLLRHPVKPDVSLELRVLDVSIGGIALMLPDSDPPIREGSRISRALISLDGDTRLQADLVVRRVFLVDEDIKGISGSRLGCEIVRISGQDERALQRYIDLTQRRRRMLAL